MPQFVTVDLTRLLEILLKKSDPCVRVKLFVIMAVLVRDTVLIDVLLDFVLIAEKKFQGFLRVWLTVGVCDVGHLRLGYMWSPIATICEHFLSLFIDLSFEYSRMVLLHEILFN